jgi:site-specific recombinase
MEDARHLLVMLDQCEEVVLKIRRRALAAGTSVR